jgi:hypothetical protein
VLDLLAPQVGLEPTTLRLTARDLQFSALLNSALYCAFSAACDREALDKDIGDYPLLPTILKEYTHKIPHRKCGLASAGSFKTNPNPRPLP